MLWILIFIFLLWCAVKKIILFVAVFITLLGCEKVTANEKDKTFSFFGSVVVAFVESEIIQDADEKGIYAPPYDFKPVENFQNYCVKNFWTKEITVRLTPIMQAEIYSLATGEGGGEGGAILLAWRDTIRSSATNQSFSVFARNIASPTTTGRTIYPKLQKELLESAYYKKSRSWVDENQDESGTTDTKNLSPERKKIITHGLSIELCVLSDLILGAHGKPSISADLMKRTNREVAAKGIKSSMEMLRNILSDESF